MVFSRQKNLLVATAMICILMTGVYFLFQYEKPTVSGALNISDNSLASQKNIDPLLPMPPPPPQKLSNPPEIIKAVYLTGYSAGSKSYLTYLNDFFRNTEINAVVVDIKGSNGYVSYASGAEDVAKYHLYNGAIKDIDSLIRFFHDQNIYVIGRISVFEDPIYSRAKPELAVYNKKKSLSSIGGLAKNNMPSIVLWYDNNGLSWLDPASKDVWDYNIHLAKDAFYHGFDEINFDYVRFPSDGKTEDMGFPFWNEKTPRSETIKDFFEYVRKSLSGEKISVDLFGLSTVSTDDMGIGQIIENAFENFNYICPMVYPSHYANGFIGFANPSEHPYDVIKYSMDSALDKKMFFEDNKNNTTVGTSASGSIETAEKLLSSGTEAVLAEFRPWIQDFNMGAEYNTDMVKQEIKATQDALGDEFRGFMLWNPSNIYTEEAVLRPN